MQAQSTACSKFSVSLAQRADGVIDREGERYFVYCYGYKQHKYLDRMES